jgi:hypothetical protein
MKYTSYQVNSCNTRCRKIYSGSAFYSRNMLRPTAKALQINSYQTDAIPHFIEGNNGMFDMIVEHHENSYYNKED